MTVNSDFAYPRDKFPLISLSPQVEAKHDEHLNCLRNYLDTYSKVGHRGLSLFDWALRLFENLSFSTVRKEHLDSLCVTKTKIVMFTVLIDDPVDNKDKRNLELADELLKIPFQDSEVTVDKLSKKDRKYLSLARDLWRDIINELQTYPYFEKYYELFLFDVHQLLNSVRYSRFVNTMPQAANGIENELYVHHGMLVLLQADLDLMCSDRFDERELPTLRKLLHTSQKLARLGNLYNSYPRELIEDDNSSEAVFNFKQKYGSDFYFRINKTIKRESRYTQFEEKLKQEWLKLYDSAKNYSSEIRSIDMDRFMKEREFIQAAYLSKADYW